MQYRDFGRLGWQVSALGFGCMRLPVKDGRVDTDEATRMLRHAIDQGVNYLDTAYGYHGGESERVLGRALSDGYRDRVWLATKFPCWQAKEAGDFDRILDEQLARLATDHIDCYLLHSLDERHWRKVRDLDILRIAQRALDDGRIRHLGFSFHDKTELFKEIVDAYPWALCQIQYNYMDVENQAGTEGLRYAAARGLAVVVMEPLLGGKLAAPPESVRRIWDAAPRRRTPADWALQWLWHQPEVSTVLSGMSSMDQVRENIASANSSAAGSLSPEELETVAAARRQYLALAPAPCTGCGYCKPCPNGVEIPANFSIYNDGVMHGLPDRGRGQYRNWLREENRASACLQCGQCEERCPQRIPIGQWMRRIHAELGGER
ncbi:MAG: aldo/keto reductase [Patescibacteria group bacterium]